MNEQTIYESLEAADEAMPNCPRAHAGSGGYHWWYIDHDRHEQMMKRGGDEITHVPCICKTCGQKMVLDESAQEYPGV